MNISLSAFAPENVGLRDGFSSPVPRQPARLHTQAESGAYLRDSSRVPRRRPFIYLNRHTPSGQTRVYRVTQLRTDSVHCRDSAGTEPVNLKVERVLPWQVTINQLIRAFLFPHPLLVWSGHVKSTGGMYSHTYSKSMDQPGQGCQSCTWSAEQGKLIFPCPRSRLRIWSRETDSSVPSRVSLLISILRLNLVLTYGIPPEFRGGVHLSAIRHRVSPEFIGSRNCVPMAFTAESPPAQGQ